MLDPSVLCRLHSAHPQLYPAVTYQIQPLSITRLPKPRARHLSPEAPAWLAASTPDPSELCRSCRSSAYTCGRPRARGMVPETLESVPARPAAPRKGAMGRPPGGAGRLRSVCVGAQPQWALRRSKCRSVFAHRPGRVDAHVPMLRTPDEGTPM